MNGLSAPLGSSLPLMLLWVFVGAGLGGVLRYLAGLLLTQPQGLPFAIGTLSVNLLGGLAAGVLYAVLGPVVLKNTPAGVFLMTGVLGGLTTFSAFTAEGMMLFQEKPALALAHAAVHVLGSLLAFGLGHRLVLAIQA